jgi:subtilisin
MIIRRLYVALGIGLAVYAGGCKKKENVTPDSDPKIAVVPCFSGLLPGRVMEAEDDFIVIYKQQADILKKNPGGRTAAISEVLLRRNGIQEGVIADSFEGFGKGVLCRLSAKEASRLRLDPDVDLVERDRGVQLVACLRVADPGTMDWGVHRVGYADGTGTTAWIIDTGIDLNHTDLNVDQIRSRSFVANEPSAQDVSGHGTHVAGIIGAKNNDFGTVGVASGANLVALKVLNQLGSGKVSTVLKALAYVGENARRGDVVNISLVSDTIFQSLDQEVTGLAERGILFAVASGNGRRDAGAISPCRVKHPNVVVTAAMDSTGRWADFSNFSPEAVRVVAPGMDIRSTSLNNGYAVMSGTSMAAPHVAGLLLLDGRNYDLRGTVRQAPGGVLYPIPHKK